MSDLDTSVPLSECKVYRRLTDAPSGILLMVKRSSKADPIIGVKFAANVPGFLVLEPRPAGECQGIGGADTAALDVSATLEIHVAAPAPYRFTRYEAGLLYWHTSGALFLGGNQSTSFVFVCVRGSADYELGKGYRELNPDNLCEVGLAIVRPKKPQVAAA